MFGKLTLHAFVHDWVQMIGVGIMLATGLIAVGFLTYYRQWKWLWSEWLTSLDPKRIGVMYTVVATIMLLKGLADAMMMRAQQAFSVGDSQGYLTADHFQQIFTAHGTTMIFFVGMGFVFGSMNFIVPLQIGARDVAFPFLNSVGFWFFAVGAALLIVSMIIGDFSATGWVCYPPLSGLKYNQGVGVDYWIWSVQIAGVGSLISGINFLVTILKMRCPGMTLMKMPLFTWCSLATLILVVFAFPILTANISLLALDRYLDMHFYTPDFGGNPMMYINLIWAWGHPEVYILVLPAFGVYSEVVATFSHKRLFGYVSMVWAIALITFLSFIVWLHHFFTMGAGADINAFFGIMTMLIAVPTGVKIFNWLFTMYRGRVHFTTPLIWFLGFMVTFSTGGMSGVLMSVAPIDFQTHNSLFLIAHFHSMVIGGVLFGLFAAIAYWFPKFAGFKLDERFGRYAAFCWIVGFLVAFMPLYALGLMGATRRLDHYDAETGWHSLFVVAGIGAALIMLGVCLQIVQVIVSIRDRKKNRDTTGDPWHGRTLEWSTTSPPPFYNFAIVPHINDHDAHWAQKHGEGPKQPSHYEDIYMPTNTPLGVLMGVFAFLFGFGLTWRIFWLAGVGLLGVIVCMVIRLSESEEETEVCITAAELRKMEKA
ncbi:MAG: cytochrome o ubiquinol oxidase subunit I [Verrucomicrobiota bacterium]|nr:cytochrome o ubiquinol oxidase subunit I [Verrucomicrobiota bacterium]